MKENFKTSLIFLTVVLLLCIANMLMTALILVKLGGNKCEQLSELENKEDKIFTTFDELYQRGYKTKRAGKTMSFVGTPSKFIEKTSPNSNETVKNKYEILLNVLSDWNSLTPNSKKAWSNVVKGEYVQLVINALLDEDFRHDFFGRNREIFLDFLSSYSSDVVDANYLSAGFRRWNILTLKEKMNLLNRIKLKYIQLLTDHLHEKLTPEFISSNTTYLMEVFSTELVKVGNNK